MKTEKWVKENLEAIAIAVVMALVIRQFAIEAFKIPTESMAPTLLGDTLGGTGDRILVDKIGYKFSEPQRGDVVVFKYPLNASKNYIKRLIGLPGEKVSIRDGDIWIDGEIWRKPPHVRDVLLFPVYPGEAEDDEELREEARRWHLPEDLWSLDEEGGFRVDAPDGESFAAFGESVKDWPPRRSGRSGYHDVGDVRLVLTVTPEGPAGGAILLRIVENGVTNEAVLAVGSGESYARHGDLRYPLEGMRLEVGRSVEVSFANVDDTLLLSVDGEEFRAEFDSEPGLSGGNTIRFGARGGAARFTDIELARDEYYVNNGVLADPNTELQIPEDCFFVLGDNSGSSKDSRLWKVQVLEMKDGSIFKYDSDPSDGLPANRRGVAPGTVVIQDHLGIVRVVREEDIARRRYSQDEPFVPRANLIGRAFFVFWPLNPFRGQFRLRFIY